MMRRHIFVVVLAVVAFGLSATEAFATHCGVVNKPVGAGANAGTVTVTLNTTGPPDVVVTPNLNPAGKPTGGFMTVSVIAPDGTVVATENVFKKDLPDGAHNSGPGDNECDGIGIDDLAECGA
jgi:hypothetical protein